MVFKRKVHILVAFICFVLCFAVTLQYKSVTKNNSAGITQLRRTEELENQLINANQQIIDLKKENMQLTTDIDAYRQDAASKDSGSGALKSELEKTLLVAGFTKVKGPGVTVSIADSTETETQVQAADSYIVHDSDLRNVVNELYSAGAEAVSINGERLIGGSSIRCVGNTIIVNSKRCSSPFVIKAIGDADTLESALNLRGGVLDVLKLYKINVNVTKASEIVLDKYSGAVNFIHAQKTEK